MSTVFAIVNFEDTQAVTLAPGSPPVATVDFSLPNLPQRIVQVEVTFTLATPTTGVEYVNKRETVAFVNVSGTWTQAGAAASELNACNPAASLTYSWPTTTTLRAVLTGTGTQATTITGVASVLVHAAV